MLRNEAVARRNTALVMGDEGMSAATVQEESLTAWDPKIVQEFEDGLIQWCIFEYANTASQSEERSVTPTQTDPHAHRTPTTPRCPNLQFAVHAQGRSQDLNLTALKIALTHAKRIHGFALAVVDASRFGELEEGYVKRGGGGVVAEGKALVFVQWGVEDEEGDVGVKGKKQKVIRRRNGVGSYDVVAAFKDTDWSIFEIDAPTLSCFLKPTHPSSVDLYLIYDATETPETINNEEVFLADGEIEEYFAHDDMNESSLDGPTTTSTNSFSKRRRGFPPITPTASIRQDIMSCVFDDLWAEVIPLLQPLIESQTERDSEHPNSEASARYTTYTFDTDDSQDSDPDLPPLHPNHAPTGTS
ncbi:hypothetical protein HDU98_004805, partial [Podochytrium sp. JEL0797]